MNRESKGMLFGLLGVTSFALTLPVIRYIIDYFDPIFIGLGRAIVAAIVALFILVVTRQSIPTREQFYKLFIVSLGVVFGFPVLTSIAMQTVPSSHGGVVLGLLPIATAIVGFLISNDRPSIGFWIVAIIGGSIVVIFSYINGANSIHIGDLALLGSIVCAAIGYAVGGELSKSMGSWQVICWALVISLPFLIFPALSRLPEEGLKIPIDIWLGFLYLALVSQLFGFFLWNKGLAIGGVVRVSQTQLVQPFITIIASTIFLNEPLELLTIFFAVLVLIVVAVSRSMNIKFN